MLISERLPVFFQPAHIVVPMQFVGVYGAFRQDVLTDQTMKRGLSDIRSGFCDDPTLALDKANDWGFLFVAAHRPTGSVLTLATEIGFVHFNGISHGCVFGEKGSDLMEHTPRGFVGDASLALDLFG